MTDEPNGIIDRRYENLKPDPYIRVLLNDGYRIRFFNTNLSDDEFIKRAEYLRDIEDNYED